MKEILLGYNQSVYWKEEGHWKKYCPKLKKQTEDDKQEGRLSMTDGRMGQWLRWYIRRPGGPSGHLPAHHYFLTGATATVDSGELVDWVFSRHRSYLFYLKQINSKEPCNHLSHRSNWVNTSTSLPSALRMPTLESQIITQLSLYAGMFHPFVRLGLAL